MGRGNPMMMQPQIIESDRDVRWNDVVSCVDTRLGGASHTFVTARDDVFNSLTRVEQYYGENSVMMGRGMHMGSSAPTFGSFIPPDIL